MSERETLHWTSVGTAWSERRPQRLWRAHSDAENRALLERWLPTGSRRLLKTDAFDEAFSGGLLGVLRERADETSLIDLSVPVLLEARRRHPESSAAVADVRRLPFHSGSFGAVASISTLDHFESAADIETSLAEIHRVLEPGGCLVVTLDNAQNPVVGLRNALPWTLLHHLRLSPYFVGATLDRHRLAATLDRAGFDVTDLDAIQHAPRALVIAGAKLVGGLGWKPAERMFLRAIAAFERARRWPSRFRTGYFVAARAVRR